MGWIQLGVAHRLAQHNVARGRSPDSERRRPCQSHMIQTRVWNQDFHLRLADHSATAAKGLRCGGEMVIAAAGCGEGHDSLDKGCLGYDYSGSARLVQPRPRPGALRQSHDPGVIGAAGEDLKR
eukprot:3081866-Rhodomonas_salina.1